MNIASTTWRQIADRTGEPKLWGFSMFISFDGCTNILCGCCLQTLRLAGKNLAQVKRILYDHRKHPHICENVPRATEQDIFEAFPHFQRAGSIISETEIPFVIPYDRESAFCNDIINTVQRLGMCFADEGVDDQICLICWQVKRRNEIACHVPQRITACAKAWFTNSVESGRIGRPLFFVDSNGFQSMVLGASTRDINERDVHQLHIFPEPYRTPVDNNFSTAIRATTIIQSLDDNEVVRQLQFPTVRPAGPPLRTRCFLFSKPQRD
jgi:hypothetical protein